MKIKVGPFSNNEKPPERWVHFKKGVGDITNETTDNNGNPLYWIHYESGACGIYPVEYFNMPGIFEKEYCSAVKIDRIDISKLFGRFNFDINLKNEENLSIITAPNGCGKTTILELIQFLFEPKPEKIHKIASIPFDSLTCLLSDGKSITLKRKELVVAKDWQTGFEYDPFFVQIWDRLIDYSISLTSGEKLIDEVKSLTETIKKKFDDLLSSKYEDYVRYSVDKYWNTVNGDEWQDFFYDNDLIKKEWEELSDLRLKYLYPAIANKIIEFSINNNFRTFVTFIEANRLSAYDFSYASGDSFKKDLFHLLRKKDNSDNTDNNNKTIKAVSFILGKLIYNANEFYLKKLLNSGNRITNEYLKSSAADAPESDYEGFRSQWTNYINTLKKYSELGFPVETDDLYKFNSYCALGFTYEIDEIDDLYNYNFQDIFQSKGKYLELYLKYHMNALEPYDAIYDKCRLLKEIFEKRNETTKKTIKFTLDGIKVFSDSIFFPFTYLSSGEKNDLVMFFHLLFNMPKNSIVLIDEPEISLHIEWQEQYLDYLLKICKMRNLQAVVATHSPHIVNSHFDLLAEKEITNE